MSPDRLTRDPVARTVEDLDRSRKWLLFLAFVVAVLVAVVIAQSLYLRDLSLYVKNPSGRDNRIEFQCHIEKELHLAEVDCRG